MSTATDPPRAEVSLSSEGHARVNLGGVEVDLSQPSPQEARAAVVAHLSRNARALGHPISTIITDPAGNWRVTVHPDGTVVTEEAPAHLTTRSPSAPEPDDAPSPETPSPSTPPTAGRRRRRRRVTSPDAYSDALQGAQLPPQVPPRLTDTAALRAVPRPNDTAPIRIVPGSGGRQTAPHSSALRAVPDDAVRARRARRPGQVYELHETSSTAPAPTTTSALSPAEDPSTSSAPFPAAPTHSPHSARSSHSAHSPLAGSAPSPTSAGPAPAPPERSTAPTGPDRPVPVGQYDGSGYDSRTEYSGDAGHYGSSGYSGFDEYEDDDGYDKYSGYEQYAESSRGPAGAPQAPDQASAGPLPADYDPRRLARSTSLLTESTNEAPATTGLRGALNQLGLHLPPTGRERSERANMAVVSQHWASPRTIAVVNGKGGAGKTPSAILLSAVFSRYGGAGVVAYDNNTTRGTLGWRTEQGPHDATVIDLLPRIEHLLSPAAQAAEISGYVHHQSQDRYDVLRSQPEVLADEQAMAGADSFDAIHSVLTKYYRLVVVDSGNDESSPQWRAMIARADAIVVPTITRPDHAESARLLLAELAGADEHAARLAENALVVVTQGSRSEPRPDRLVSTFREIARAAVGIPYDTAMAGRPLILDSLAPATRRAWLEAGTALAVGLSQQRPTVTAS